MKFLSLFLCLFFISAPIWGQVETCNYIKELKKKRKLNINILSSYTRIQVDKFKKKFSEKSWKKMETSFSFSDSSSYYLAVDLNGDKIDDYLLRRTEGMCADMALIITKRNSYGKLHKIRVTDSCKLSGTIFEHDKNYLILSSDIGEIVYKFEGEQLVELCKL